MSVPAEDRVPAVAPLSGGEAADGQGVLAGLSPDFVRSAAAQRLKALGHPDRLRIVELLSRHPMNVGELAAALCLSMNAASRHLRTLRDAGVVHCSQRGNHVLYALADRDVPRLAAVAYRGAATQVRKVIATAPLPRRDGSVPVDR